MLKKICLIDNLEKSNKNKVPKYSIIITDFGRMTLPSIKLNFRIERKLIRIVPKVMVKKIRWASSFEKCLIIPL